VTYKVPASAISLMRHFVSSSSIKLW